MGVFDLIRFIQDHGNRTAGSKWLNEVQAAPDLASFQSKFNTVPVSDPELAARLQQYALQNRQSNMALQDAERQQKERVTLDDFIKKVDASGLALPSEMDRTYGQRPTLPDLTKDLTMFAADQNVPTSIALQAAERLKGATRDAKVENVSGVPRVMDNDALTSLPAGGYTAPREYKTVNDRLGFVGEDGTWQEVPGSPQPPKKAPQTRTRPAGNVDIFEQYDDKAGRWVEISRSPRWKPGDDGKSEEREYRRKKDAEAAAERDEDNARATYNMIYPVSFMGERVSGAPPYAQWKATQWASVRDAGKPKPEPKQDKRTPQSRFSSDPQMKGNRLGKKTSKGIEVFNAQGKLIGYYD